MLQIIQYEFLSGYLPAKKALFISVYNVSHTLKILGTEYQGSLLHRYYNVFCPFSLLRVPLHGPHILRDTSSAHNLLPYFSQRVVERVSCHFHPIRVFFISSNTFVTLNILWYFLNVGSLIFSRPMFIRSIYNQTCIFISFFMTNMLH